MIALVTLIYVALISLTYKVLKIKPTSKNIAAMVVLGVVLIGSIVIMWKFSAPTSSNLVIARYTVQLVPQVKGHVTKIHAEPNVPLRKGKDLLFEIQNETYVNSVDELTASLEAAKKNTEQLEAARVAAEAGVKKAAASRDASKVELDIALNMQKANIGAISKLEVQQLTEQLKATEAAVDQSQALSLQAEIATLAAESTARSLEAELENAKFNLDQCKVYAPSDGFVTAWTVREGTMAVPLPLTQLGTFVDTTEAVLIASYPQNILKNVKAGDAAELTFKTKPGQVFPATVDTVIQATGEGQMPVSGILPNAADLESSGMFIVKFVLDESDQAAELAIGTSGTAVIFTDKGKPFHVISKVVVRMNAWMYYLNPF